MTEREFEWIYQELCDENRGQRAVIRQLQKDIDGLRRLIAELVSALSNPAPRGWHGIQDPNQDLIERAQQEALKPAKRLRIFDKAKGYAATPGSGPLDQTCRSCKHYDHNRGSEGRGRPHPKCGLMRAIWTNGAGTDIKASSPACSHWEAKHQ